MSEKVFYVFSERHFMGLIYSGCAAFKGQAVILRLRKLEKPLKAVVITTVTLLIGHYSGVGTSLLFFLQGYSFKQLSLLLLVIAARCFIV